MIAPELNLYRHWHGLRPLPSKDNFLLYHPVHILMVGVTPDDRLVPCIEGPDIRPLFYIHINPYRHVSISDNMDREAVIHGDTTDIKILTDGESYVAVGGKTLDFTGYDTCADGSPVYQSIATLNPAVPRADVIGIFIKHWIDNGESHPDIVCIDNALPWSLDSCYLDNGLVGKVFSRRKCSVLRI